VKAQKVADFAQPDWQEKRSLPKGLIEQSIGSMRPCVRLT